MGRWALPAGQRKMPKPVEFRLCAAVKCQTARVSSQAGHTSDPMRFAVVLNFALYTRVLLGHFMKSFESRTVCSTNGIWAPTSFSTRGPACWCCDEPRILCAAEGETAFPKPYVTICSMAFDVWPIQM